MLAQFDKAMKDKFFFSWSVYALFLVDSVYITCILSFFFFCEHLQFLILEWKKKKENFSQIINMTCIWGGAEKLSAQPISSQNLTKHQNFLFFNLFLVGTSQQLFSTYLICYLFIFAFNNFFNFFFFLTFYFQSLIHLFLIQK